MRAYFTLPDLLVICFCAGIGIIAFLGWIMPADCPAADVIFHPSACEVG